MASGPVQAARFPIGNDKTLDPKLTGTCSPRHWDPTMIFRRSVYQGPEIALPMDPRPWTKICLQYVNSGPATPAPAPPANVVFTGASQFYPPTRYPQNIDRESLLERLDRPLNQDLLPGPNSCFPEQYVMPANSDALQQYVLLPPQTQPKSKMVRSLADPPVLERNGQYRCSEEAMVCDLRAAPRFFNNCTKQQKYNQKDNYCGAMLWQTNNGKDPSPANLPRPPPN